MSQLQKRLRIVWDNDPPKRYIPRSLNGGTGWGVFDRAAVRFLTNDEVRKLAPESLSTETITN